MNKKQKIVLVVGAVLIFSALILWLAHGGDIFTKTQVLIEKQDDLFGTTYNEWQDKIVIGLDYAGGFSGIVAAITGVLFFFFRTKKIVNASVVDSNYKQMKKSTVN
jgi:hypothetical protein